MKLFYLCFENFKNNILIIKQISNFNIFSKHNYIYYLFKMFYISGSQTYFGKCHQMWHSEGVKCQLNIFQVLNKVVNCFILIYMLNLYFILEVLTAPKFPPQPANFFVRSGPELIYCITKFVQWFNFLLWGGGTKTHEIFLKYGYNL